MEILNEIVLYVYLGVFFVMSIFLFSYAIYDNSKKKDIEEEREFYFRQKSVREVWRKKGNTIIPGCIIWTVIAGVFFVLVYNMAGEEKVRNLWSGIGKYIEDLPGVMLSGLGAITMLSGFVGFRKDTWIGLNGNVILKRYGIIRRLKQILLVVGVSYIMLFLSAFIKNGEEGYRLYFAVKSLVFYGFISFLCLFIKCIWSMLEILMGERVAHKRIKELYQEFWYTSISRVERSGREEEIVRMLLSNHKEVSGKINLIQNIEDVEFDTNIKEGEDGRYKDLVFTSSIRFIILYFIIFCIGGLVLLYYCRMNENIFVPRLVYLCGILAFGVCSVTFCLFSKGVRVAVISIFYGRCGYKFIPQKGKVKYTREVPLITRKYHKYVQVTKSFLAFFLMHLKSGHEDVLKIIINECKRKLRDNPKLYVDISILLVVMDYMYYRETKKFFTDIDLGDEHRKYYTKIARAFAVDTMDDIFGDKVDMTMFDEYIAERERDFGTKKKKGNIKNIQIEITLPKNSKVSIMKS